MEAAPNAAPAESPQAPAPEQGGDAPAELPSWEEAKAGAAGEEGGKKPDPKAPPKKDGEGEAEQPKKVKFTEWQTYQHKTKRLAEREAAFEQKYTQGKQELAALEKRAAELEQRAQFLDGLETDPKAFVSHMAKKLGMSEAKVINSLNLFFLEGKSPQDIEIEKLKADQKRRDDEAAAEKKRQAQQQDQAKIDGYKQQIAAHVSANDDAYPHLGAFRPHAVANAAWQRIVEHFEQTGQNKSLDKVLSELEAEEEAMFLRKEERRRRKLGSAAQVQTPERGGAVQPANRDAQQRPSTLNHRLAAQRSPQAPGASDRESWEDAKRNAGF